MDKDAILDTIRAVAVIILMFAAMAVEAYI